MPIIKEMQQGSAEWHALRKNSIGSSDSAAILGISPWCTPYLLWLRKSGLAPEQEDNSSMARGRMLEPIALQMFNDSNGYTMKPTVVVNPLYLWQIASLDGYDADRNEFCEIKAASQTDHCCAINQEIPEKYVPQIMKQFLVTGAKKGYYVSYCPQYIHAPFIVLEILRTAFQEFQYSELMEKEKEFYRRMVEFDPPPMCEKDFVESQDPQLVELLRKWREVKEERVLFDEMEAELRAKIITKCQNQSTLCDGVKISKFYRKGIVDYGNIPEIQNVDTEKYRRPSTQQWRLTCE